jgi:hypothetical protein
MKPLQSIPLKKKTNNTPKPIKNRGIKTMKNLLLLIKIKNKGAVK